ncbi:HYR domain protein [uncultured archaeon]|nr:HYR domain protein [uncultured archaeon]
MCVTIIFLLETVEPVVGGLNVNDNLKSMISGFKLPFLFLFVIAAAITASATLTVVSPTPANNSLLGTNSYLINVTATGSDTDKFWCDAEHLVYLTYNLTWLNATKVNFTNTTSTKVNFTGLPNGTFLLQTTEVWTYEQGNSCTSHTDSDSDTRTFRIDTTAPQISYINSTLTNGSYTRNNWIFVNVSTSDVNYNYTTFNLYGPNSNSLNKSVNVTSGSSTNFTGLSSGTYVFNATAYDKAGNKNSTSSRTVIVDTIAPVIGSVSNVTSEATNASGASVTYTIPTATDNIDSSVTVTCLPGSGSVFALGNTGVTCNAQDTAGNNATSVTFNVTVQDTTPPVVTVPSDITKEATASTTQVTFTAPSATDLVDGSVTTTCTHNSGDLFPVGVTTINCSATDSHGNTGSAIFSVTITDTTPPEISGTPSDITAEATNSSGAVVEYSLPTANDLVDGSTSVSCLPASGSVFALDATTLVTCSSTDSHGNTGTSNFNVKVQDTTAPVITLYGSSSLILEYGDTYNDAGATASDAVDGNLTGSIVTVNSVNSSAVGDYTVTYDVTDAHGNKATQVVRTVHVIDTDNPVITLLGFDPVTLEVHSTYNDAGATAIDDVDGDLTNSIVTNNPVNSDVVGNYTVTYNVNDAHGNSATQVTRTVSIIDNESPVLTGTPEDFSVEATSGDGATVNYDAPTATDNYDSEVSVSCLPASGNNFALGSTQVNCSSTDSNGNTGTSSFTVTVKDTTAPNITITNADTSPAKFKTVNASAVDLVSESTLSYAIVSSDTNCTNVEVWTPYDESVTLNSESDNGKIVCFRATDGSDNTDYSSSDVISGIDTTPPVVTFTSNSPVNNSITTTPYMFVQVTVNDTNAVNLTYDLSTFEVDPVLTTTETSHNFTELSANTYFITVTATDAAGNVGSTETRTVKVLTDQNYEIQPTESTLTPSDSNQEFNFTFNSSVDDNQTFDLNLTPFLTGSTATYNGSITITRDNFSIEFPAGITFNGTNWDGLLNLPTLQNASNYSVSSGTVDEVLALGSANSSITFDKPVKITLFGKTGKNAGFTNGNSFTIINLQCNSATNPTNIGNAECYFDDGTNLIIFTMHFTSFATITPAPVTPPSNNNGGGSPSSGSGSGSSSSTSSSSGSGFTSVVATPTPTVPTATPVPTVTAPTATPAPTTTPTTVPTATPTPAPAITPTATPTPATAGFFTAIGNNSYAMIGGFILALIGMFFGASRLGLLNKKGKQ